MKENEQTEVNEADNNDEDDEDWEDKTCCHRATFCNPIIREIIVTDVIFAWLGKRVTWADLFCVTINAGTILIGWTVLYCLLGETMLPGGSSFGLFGLILFSYSLGWGLTYIPYLNLPPVFGMLLAGMIVRNTDLYNIREQLGIDTTSKIRTFCLTFIMIRAGLQMTTTALRKYPVFTLILALVPCSIETFVLGVCSRYVLNYPWDWSFMAGTIIACMSPVVTVNCILALAEQGYGEDKGFATLLCTATSIDDIWIVSLFSICYTIVYGNVYTTTGRWWMYIRGLGDLLAGLGVGIILGLFLTFFPHRNYKYAMIYRILGLILSSLMCSTAAAKVAVSGAGYLAALIVSFIAMKGWRILTPSFDTMPLRKAAFLLWHLTQPVLVGVIGADIDFVGWSAGRFGLHLTCIIVGLSARSITTFLTTFRSPFTWKERIFVVIAWLPKGTLQAALAPIAFERAKKEEDPTKIELAIDLIRISVVAVIFLAPLGAFAMTTSGPFLLNRISSEQHRRDRELSYLHIVSLQPVRMRDKKKSPAT